MIVLQSNRETNDTRCCGKTAVLTDLSDKGELQASRKINLVKLVE